MGLDGSLLVLRLAHLLYGGPLGLGQIFPLFLIAGLFYFLIIKPQNDEQAAHQALLASLSKHDWVVTSSGIHGRIVRVDDTTVVLEIDERSKLTLEKSSVARRVENTAKS